LAWDKKFRNSALGRIVEEVKNEDMQLPSCVDCLPQLLGGPRPLQDADRWKAIPIHTADCQDFARLRQHKDQPIFRRFDNGFLYRHTQPQR
jgi:hypothetical protein